MKSSVQWNLYKVTTELAIEWSFKTGGLAWQEQTRFYILLHGLANLSTLHSRYKINNDYNLPIDLSISAWPKLCNCWICWIQVKGSNTKRLYNNPEKECCSWFVYDTYQLCILVIFYCKYILNYFKCFSVQWFVGYMQCSFMLYMYICTFNVNLCSYFMFMFLLSVLCQKMTK